MLILIDAFSSLAFQVLAQTSEREHRSVHIRRKFSFANKGERSCRDLQPNYVSCIIQKILMSTQSPSLVNNHRNSAAIISFPSYPYVINNNKIRKRRNFQPLQTRRAYTWTSSLPEQTRDSNQSTDANFCCPPITRETKRESREARSGYRITCPVVRGVFDYSGVTGV